MLKIYIWAGLFIFLGVAIGRYLIAENYTKVIFARSFIGMIANVLFNIILIPRYGLKGAAIATVVSYFIATFFIGLLPRTKKQAVLMLKSANFFSIFGFLKQQNIKRTRINTD